MGRTHTAGFTILETMLFLAITGVLVVAILAGVGTSINTQRYTDSISSFKSLIQDQYSELTNVYNDRDNTWSCGDTAETVDSNNSSQDRGQSDCVILGRYIVVDGSDTSIADVTGYEAITPSTTSGSDIDVLKNDYVLGLSTVSTDTSTLEWGTKISWPVVGSESKSAGTPRSIAILMVRSPTSGTVYTFTADTPPTFSATKASDLLGMLVVGNTIPGQAGRTICVDSDGLSLTGNQAIYIDPYTTNESGIETRTNAVTAQLGGDAQC